MFWIIKYQWIKLESREYLGVFIDLNQTDSIPWLLKRLSWRFKGVQKTLSKTSLLCKTSLNVHDIQILKLALSGNEPHRAKNAQFAGKWTAKAQRLFELFAVFGAFGFAELVFNHSTLVEGIIKSGPMCFSFSIENPVFMWVFFIFIFDHYFRSKSKISYSHEFFYFRSKIKIWSEII